MLSNANKLRLIAQRCSRGIPLSITTTPGISHHYSASPLYKQLKKNQHFIEAIFESAKEYDETIKKINKHETIVQAAGCDANAPAVGTRIKISEFLYANVYDTPQFNFENRDCCIYYKDLFEGKHALFTFDNINDKIVLKNGWQDDVRNLMVKYDLIPKCIRKISFIKDDPKMKNGIISFIGYCADKFETYECGNKITLKIPIKVNNYDEIEHDHSTVARIEFERLCCHLDGYQQTTNLKRNNVQVQKQGYKHSMTLTHQSELMQEKPENVLFGATQQIAASTNQIRTIISSLRKQHRRDPCPHKSIQKLQDETVLKNCQSLQWNREQISGELLSTVSCVHNYHPYMPITLSRYSHTTFPVYPVMKDYFIDNGGGMISTVTNGLTEDNSYASKHKPSTFKLDVQLYLLTDIGKNGL
eukprot:73762_1